MYTIYTVRLPQYSRVIHSNLVRFQKPKPAPFVAFLRMAVYYDNVREYLAPPSERSGVHYIRDAAPSEPRTVAPAPKHAVDVRARMIERLRAFFSKEDRFGHLRTFLAKQGTFLAKQGEEAEARAAPPPVSLRILEFLCTDNGLVLQEEPAADRNLTDDFQHMLKAHSKAYFDIFARGERFDFQVEGSGSVKTTLGQLQFFKWAIERGLLERVEREKETLRREAKERNAAALGLVKEPTKRPAQPQRVRRHQLVARMHYDGPFTVRLGA